MRDVYSLGGLDGVLSGELFEDSGGGKSLAACVEAILRRIQKFCVTDGWACPSWLAMVRAETPALSSSVAVVLRKMWLLTHGMPHQARH